MPPSHHPRQRCRASRKRSGLPCKQPVSLMNRDTGLCYYHLEEASVQMNMIRSNSWPPSNATQPVYQWAAQSIPNNNRNQRYGYWAPVPMAQAGGIMYSRGPPVQTSLGLSYSQPVQQSTSTPAWVSPSSSRNRQAWVSPSSCGNSQQGTPTPEWVSPPWSSNSNGNGNDQSDDSGLSNSNSNNKDWHNTDGHTIDWHNTDWHNTDWNTISWANINWGPSRHVTYTIDPAWLHGDMTNGFDFPGGAQPGSPFNRQKQPCSTAATDTTAVSPPATIGAARKRTWAEAEAEVWGSVSPTPAGEEDEERGGAQIAMGM